MVDHRFEAFKIEEALLKDARTLRDFAGCLKDTADYPAAARLARPIVARPGSRMSELAA
jgi:hypothetical protein